MLFLSNQPSLNSRVFNQSVSIDDYWSGCVHPVLNIEVYVM